jgi:beta-ribofuranosylaminobenzene 5'-phosphate synthase
MQVTVKTPSRLHLGMIDLNGGLGRIYGSLGVALDKPFILVEARSSDALEVRGEDTGRVKHFIEKFSQVYNVDDNVEVDVKQTILEHVGLGSGTQLSLAIASCMSHINKLNVGVRDLAKAMDRGVLSGIGVEAFRKGGFIIDGGHKVDGGRQVPTVVYRQNFPEDWTFILAVPAVRRGFSGGEEESAFRRVIPASAEIARDICWLLQMKMLPSLIEEDIECFGQALMEVDRKVGLYFKEVQRGIYKEKITQSLIDCMLESGSYGAGQSSWGPAVYGIIDDGNAKKLESSVNGFLKENDMEGTLLRTHANNHGAEISMLEDAR